MSDKINDVASDETVRLLPVLPDDRAMVEEFIAAPSDEEIVSFRRGVYANRRGEGGTILDSFVACPESMICRVAWRTGWSVMEKAKAAR